MAYTHTDDVIGVTQLTSVDDTQRMQQGLTVKGSDPTLGMGRFMYLNNISGGSIAAGDVCLIDERTGAIKKVVTADRGPVGVAVAAQAATQWGWFQIEGIAVVNATTGAANSPAYEQATGGNVLSTVSATNKIDGMVYKTANGTPAAGQAYVQIQHPSANGNG